MPIDLSKTVIVFDLDDTIYNESDYVVSGIRFVCEKVKEIYGVNCYPEIQKAVKENPNIDWIGLIIDKLNLPEKTKESLLWIYRLHEPDIHLSEACKSSLDRIQKLSSACVLLTDGRSITQRLKIQALGLSAMPLFISEEFGSEKPSPDRFVAIQNIYTAKHYVYIADNVQKDFKACNQLNWVSICMRGKRKNIHSQSILGLSNIYHPNFWVENWEELWEFFENK